MADPRFYDNSGPFTLAAICARAGVNVPDGAESDASIADVASLSGAGPQHLSFLSGTRAMKQFAQSHAGFCFVSPDADAKRSAPGGITVIIVDLVQHAFAETAEFFYPDHSLVVWSQTRPSIRQRESARMSCSVPVW